MVNPSMQLTESLPRISQKHKTDSPTWLRRQPGLCPKTPWMRKTILFAVTSGADGIPNLTASLEKSSNNKIKVILSMCGKDKVSNYFPMTIFEASNLQGW